MQEVYFEEIFSVFSTFISDGDELIIICPYIKVDALQKLFARIDPKAKVLVIVRWKISDLVMGSSDLEIYNFLKLKGLRLFINSKIHLKIVVKDKSTMLVGSANITNPGFGLSERSNIEAVCAVDTKPAHLLDIKRIMKSSIEVTDKLYEQIEIEVKKFSKLRQDMAKEEIKMKEIDKKIGAIQTENIVVDDFPFCNSPTELLRLINDNQRGLPEVIHDLAMLNLSLATKESLGPEHLSAAFLQCDAYRWQQNNVQNETLFGKYSEMLHDALLDDPKPYRKQVKELVSNMFSWTEACSDQYEIKKFGHTKSLLKRK